MGRWGGVVWKLKSGAGRLGKWSGGPCRAAGGEGTGAEQRAKQVKKTRPRRGERDRERQRGEREQQREREGGSQVRHQRGLLPFFPQRGSLLPLLLCECASDGSSPCRRLISNQGAKPLPLPLPLPSSLLPPRRAGELRRLRLRNSLCVFTARLLKEKFCLISACVLTMKKGDELCSYPQQSAFFKLATCVCIQYMS